MKIPKRTRDRIAQAVRKIEGLPLNLSGGGSASQRTEEEPWLWAELTGSPVESAGVWWWPWKKQIPDGSGGFQDDPDGITGSYTAFEVNNYGGSEGDIIRLWSVGYVNGTQAWCYQTRNEVMLAKFTGSSYPTRYYGDPCTRYPAKLLPSATFTESTCYESLSEGSEGDEIIVFNLDLGHYIPENWVGIVWRHNDRWYTSYQKEIYVAKTGTSGSYPTDTDCDRLPCYLLPDVTFDDSTTCSDFLSNDSPADEIIVWNLGSSPPPEDTTLPIFLHNGRWYMDYGDSEQLKWGKVQSGYTNVTATSTTIVSVVSCDIDGNNETGSPFDIFTPIRANKATALFTDYVVGYMTDPDGNEVIVTDCYDDDFFSIRLWSDSSAGTPQNIPDGWRLCDSSAYVDLSGQFVLSYESGAFDMDATGGYEWHGNDLGSSNNHPVHATHDAHTHPLTRLSCVYVAAGLDHIIEVLDTSATGAENIYLEHDAHTGPFNTNEDTSNLPPYFVLAYIERFE